LPATSSRKLILIVIDGLTPSMLEAADDRTPTLRFLLDAGSYRRATSVFPSLTPVCLSSLATGAYPAVHRIPHLVWYHREERRLVEYGSSFAALRVAGVAQSILDTIFNMNQEHLARDAVTLYEALEDAGLVSAAVNITCYRGRHRYLPVVPGSARVAYGPRRFFFYNLFESDLAGAPLAIRNRAAGSIDSYAAAVGRWLVTRDGFDFLAYYLSDLDFESHLRGPDAVQGALERCDAAVDALVSAAGGPAEFLERYAVVLCSDHGQTHVAEAVSLEEAYADVEGVLVTASNRAGMVYRLPGCRLEPAELARRLDGRPGADVAAWLEDGDALVRTDGAVGRAAELEHPDAEVRLLGALRNPNAGELLVSAAPGYEFADLAGRHHAGGGSHGSLAAGDSTVPMLTVSLEGVPGTIVDVAPRILAHFGVEPPPYARPLVAAA
jgi:hypothetical protein